MAFGFAQPMMGGLGPLQSHLAMMQRPQAPQQQPNGAPDLSNTPPMSISDVMGGLRKMGVPLPGGQGAAPPPMAAPPPAGGTGLPSTYDPGGTALGPFGLPGASAGAGGAGAAAGAGADAGADAAAGAAGDAAAGGGGFADFLAALFG